MLGDFDAGSNAPTPNQDTPETKCACDWCGDAGKIPHPVDYGTGGDWRWMPCPRCRTQEFMRHYAIEVKRLNDVVQFYVEQVSAQRTMLRRQTRAEEGPSPDQAPQLSSRVERLEHHVDMLLDRLCTPTQAHGSGCTSMGAKVTPDGDGERPKTKIVCGEGAKPHPLFDGPDWNTDGLWWWHTSGSKVRQKHVTENGHMVNRWFATRKGEEQRPDQHGPFVDVDDAVDAALRGQ